MSEIRTLHFLAVLSAFILFGCLDGRAFAADLIAEIVTDKPTRYARTLALDSENRLWASFMNEQGLDSWGIARLETASPTLFPAAGLSVRRVHALRAAPGAGIAAATDDGLRIVTPDGRIDVHANGDRLTHLAPGAGNSLLAAGSADDGGLVLARYRSGRPIERWRLQTKKAALSRDLLNVFELPDGRVLIVLSTDVVMLEGGKLRRLDWTKTPLASPARGRSAERRMPPLWIYDAAMAPDGGVYFIGACKKLVRWRNDRFDTLAEGHFQDLAVDPSSGVLWVTDFAGTLKTWDGKSLELAYRLPDGEIRNIWPAASGTLWLECAHASGPHRLARLSPGLADPDTVSLDFRPGLLSPGILSLVQAPDGVTLIATNEGLWRIRDLETSK
ncbi:MAG TPA: hypothetical protein PLU72_12815 [Candidatus Ozemobacteraceae bacterium]|nr:hypothetical protein [Candidatus Ozemobacteraceae bacterium]